MPLWMKMRHLPEGTGMVAAVMIAFLIVGVWHGAGWGFVLFGLMHGALVVASNDTLRSRDAAWLSAGVPTAVVHCWRVIWTFILVVLTFVVYRANSLHDAWLIYRDLLPDHLLRSAHQVAKHYLQHEPDESRGVGLKSSTWLIIGLIVIGDILARSNMPLEKFPRVVQFAIYNIGALFILYGWISAGAGQPFLYYRF